MPIVYERDDVSRRIMVTLDGAVSPEDALALYERQAADGAWHYGLLCIADKSDVPSAEDVRLMVANLERLVIQHGVRGPVAILSRMPELYEPAGLYSSLSAKLHQDIAIFRTAGDADHWLAEQARAQR